MEEYYNKNAIKDLKKLDIISNLAFKICFLCLKIPIDMLNFNDMQLHNICIICRYLYILLTLLIKQNVAFITFGYIT